MTTSPSMKTTASATRPKHRFYYLLLLATGLITSGTALANPDAAGGDDPLAPLIAAYVHAVKHGEQVEMYRELFSTVLQRVQRSYPQEVQLSPLITAALNAIEPLAPESGEPATVFKASINAALA